MRPTFHYIFEKRFRISSAPLKTGQTVQYDGKKDDGYYKKGISQLYEVLTLGQYSGTTAITVNGKTINMENRCAKDMRTGKMWMARTPDSDLGPGNDGKLLWKDAVNSEDIFEFCDQANAVNFAGHNDWRVPNVNEILTIVDYSQNAPSINATVFPGTASNHYWTGTDRADNPGSRCFSGSFIYGGTGSAVHATAYYVRLVRDI